jgi:hypothetical protein
MSEPVTIYSEGSIKLARPDTVKNLPVLSWHLKHPTSGKYPSTIPVDFRPDTEFFFLKPDYTTPDPSGNRSGSSLVTNSVGGFGSFWPDPGFTNEKTLIL